MTALRKAAGKPTRLCVVDAHARTYAVYDDRQCICKVETSRCLMPYEVEMFRAEPEMMVDMPSEEHRS